MSIEQYQEILGRREELRLDLLSWSGSIEEQALIAQVVSALSDWIFEIDADKALEAVREDG